eukprot:CAMPEP_0182836512 /NCGR_PEP_ID=MMETSP0006_2-20121128/22151_1 /TAXON_ID=97485 /ORGANISM="Prymnesium parvum, Strain Texoma1" /LENGTH=405 /DNA_ID=CAMNT_0024965157 /DNA_START=65 /DNA_END=1282 /DNA_ORIENTATION=-
MRLLQTARAPRPVMTLNGDAAVRSAAASALAAILLFSPLPPSPITPVGMAHARELASGSGSRVNKDPNSLLRLGLPGQPKQIRELQAALEESQDNLQRLLFSNSKGALQKAKGALKSTDPITKAVPSSDSAEASTLLATIKTDVDAVLTSIAANDASAAIAANEDSLKQLSRLEEIIATKYPTPKPPAEFAGLPYLKGRADIEFVLKRPGEKFDVDGKLYDTLNIKARVDGYTAPITAGNFVDLVQKGFYNGMHIQRSDGFVVQTGDPSQEGDKKAGAPNGFVPSGGSAVRKIPLEVFVSGDKAPIYGATFDDDGRGGYASQLPFNAYGALGMAREEYDPDSASSQWFWLLFDSDLTPAGKNLLDGRYACFGYTIEGNRLLSDVKEGDVIVSAKVVKGLDLLDTV